MKIIHLIYAADDTQAGNYFNNSTINYIRNCIQAKVNYKKFDVVHNLKDYFYKFSSNIIKEYINKKYYLFNDDIDVIKINKPFTLKKVMGSFLDDYISNSRYVPEYSEKIDIKNKLYYIIINCPGNGEITYYKVDYDEYYTSVMIEGIKLSEIINDKNKVIFRNGLTSGPFKIFIKINCIKEYAYISKKMESIKNQDGYLICSFKILKDEEN